MAGFEDRERRWPSLMLFVPAVLLFALAGGALAYGLVTRNSSTANAAESVNTSEIWAFVPGAMSELSSTAVQLCANDASLAAAAGTADEARLQAQQISLEAHYETVAEAYDEHVSDTIHNGNVRPWDVSPVAPPASVSKDKSCLKLAAVPKPKISPVYDDRIAAADAPDRFLTLDQLDAAAAAAGWPMGAGWWPDMKKIIQCETHSLDRFAHNVDDPNGGSYGLAQLNGTQHFINSGEDFNQWMDPVVNLRVALWLRTVRGHFGGSGGWMICSERWGIE